MSADTMGWQARPGTAEDLAGLADLEGHPLPDLETREALWVVTPDRGPAAGRPVAALRVSRGTGEPPPRAWFRLGWAVHASAELGLYRRQRTLLLGNDLSEADELGAWAVATALDPAAAQPAWSALLRAALATASGLCIARLPGLRDGTGRSPVWQGLGRHFHAGDPEAAQRRHGAGWEDHLAPLLPRQLIYASLLPSAAQEALGHELPAASPLRAALHAAGFEWRDHVGLSDGGPVLERWPPRG